MRLMPTFKRRRTLATLAAAYLGLATGCLAPNDAQPESDTRDSATTDTSGSDTSTDPDTAVDTDTVDTGTDTTVADTDTADTDTSPDTTDPVDPNDPAQPESRAWCVPEARSATPTYLTPSPGPEVFDRACGLVNESYQSSAGARATVNEYRWKDGELWVYYDRDQYYSRLQRFRFDAADNVVEVSWGERHWSRLYAFNPHEAVYRTRYDAAGNLVELATLEGATEDVYLTKRWDDGRLVARTETRNRFTVEANDYVRETLETTWSYDAGRLVRATALGFGHAWSVDYAYDALGRLVELVRQRDDEEVERLTYTFDAQNRLASRSLERDARAAQDDGWSPSDLDTFGLVVGTDWQGDAWAASVPRLTESGCLLPPNGLQYGYPGAEAAYDLGMPRDDRPSGIGFAYGANTYGWNYGDLSWYSHTGVHGLEPDWAMSTLTAIETRYVAGRMVEETISSPDSALRDSHRERRFDAGRLVEDRMDFTVSLDGYDQVPDLVRAYGRSLRYGWDGARLLERTLHDDDLGHLETQRWTRDAENRWLTHTVFQSTANARVPSWAGEAPYCPSTGLEAPCPAEPPTRIAMVYERELDAAGRTVARRALRPDAAGVPVLERDERWSYDAAGRVTEVAHSADWVERFEYDAQGRLVRHLWDYGSDASYNGAEETNYDARGRWISVVNLVNGDVTATRTRTFACE